MDRRLIARELEAIARELVGFEFPTKDSLDKYLKDHPQADKSLHTVKKEEKPAAPEQKPEQKPSKPEEKPPEAEHPKIKKMKESLPPELKTKDEHETYKEKISQYKVEIVGDNEENAKKVAAELARGIKETADVCKVNPPICEGNLGIPRSNMPQLHDKSLKDMRRDVERDEVEVSTLTKKSESSKDEKERQDLTTKAQSIKSGVEDKKKRIKAAIDAGADPEDDKSTTDKLLDHMEKSGVEIQGRKGDVVKVPVGKLRATQREIQARKTVDMADSYFAGRRNFKPNKDPIIVSTEEDGSHCILDGHHRWSSALMSDPGMEMSCVVVKKPIRDMLTTAMKMPGVYRADLKGNIIPKDSPVDLSGWKQGEERKVTEARLAVEQLSKLAECIGI